MFYDTSASHRPRRASLFSIALWPWRMLVKLRAERRTRAQLWRLDDYMLKDIGLSRGSIESAVRKGHIRD